MVNNVRTHRIQTTIFSTELYRKTHRGDKKFSKFRTFWNILIGTYNPMRINTLLILFIFGVGGVLVDLDHFIVTETQMYRPLHLPYWITIGVICICYCAYAYRRIYKSGLKEVINE